MAQHADTIESEPATIFYKGWVIHVWPEDGHWEWDAFLPDFTGQDKADDKDAALVAAMTMVDATGVEDDQ